MKSISNTIKKQSLKETLLFLVISSLVLTSFLVYLSYIQFFEITDKVVNIGISNISRGMHNGDEFSIKSELSFFVEKEGFYGSWVEDKAGYRVSEAGKAKITKSHTINNDFNLSFQLQSAKILLIKKFTLSEHVGKLFVVQEINILYLILKYIVMYLFVILFSKILQKYRINSYKMFTDSIVKLSNLVSKNKENPSLNLAFSNNEYEEIIELYENINKYINILKEDENNKIKILELTTVVNTIQMLAHDVRKPFSMLIAVINITESINDIEKIKAFLKKANSDIKLNLEKVTGMLFDIMHFGDEKKLEYNTINLEGVFFQSVKQCLLSETDSDVFFYINFKHQFKLFYSSIKLERIFVNLLTNALEAMKLLGEIHIETKNILHNDKPFIQFSFANNNSHIPSEVLSKIFELHFTYGKISGTGIGLYTVKKFIEHTGGYICCNSDPEKGVEFVFTLPSSNEEVEEHIEIKSPVHSSELKHQYYENLHNSSINKISLKNIMNYIDNLKRKISILVIDDDNYLLNFKYIFKNLFPNMDENFILYFSSDYDNSIRSYEAEKPDIIITDVDLKCQKNGLDILHHIHNIDKNAFVAIHSNRVFIGNEFTLSGENLFLEKPIDNNKILQIFSEYISHVEKINPSQLKEEVAKEIIIVVDDEQFYLDMWKNSLHDANVLLFNHPEIFLDYMTENKEILNNVSCIILDYFYNGSKLNIVEMNFVDLLRRYGYKNPCMLSSNILCSENELSIFDGFIDKQPHTFSKIKSLFPSKFSENIL